MARRADPPDAARKPRAGTNRPRRSRQVEEEGAPEKLRVPAESQPQRPGAPPIGNGGTEEPPAFPPHN